MILLYFYGLRTFQRVQNFVSKQFTHTHTEQADVVPLIVVACAEYLWRDEVVQTEGKGHFLPVIIMVYLLLVNVHCGGEA